MRQTERSDFRCRAAQADNATAGGGAVERFRRGKEVREVFRDRPYTDPAGQVWTPIAQESGDYWTADLGAAVERARRDGTRVILLTSGGNDAGPYRQVPRRRRTFELCRRGWCIGALPGWGSGSSDGATGCSDGLPSDCVLDWPYQIGQGKV